MNFITCVDVNLHSHSLIWQLTTRLECLGTGFDDNI